MDLYGYLDTAMKIIKKFDALAPYEKFSGGKELELSFMMDDLRKSMNVLPENSSDSKKAPLSSEAQEYVQYIMEDSDKKLTHSVTYAEAVGLLNVIYCYQENGEASALTEFDSLAMKIIEESNGSAAAVSKISYMAGTLYPNEVLTKDESEKLGKKYAQLFIRRWYPNTPPQNEIKK